MRRRQPTLERKYRVPLYPVVPALAILGGLFVVVSQLFMSGSSGRIMSLSSVAVTLVGLPVYLAVQKRQKAH
jgi:APA family basic amino acid/polyamine antiporter